MVVVECLFGQKICTGSFDGNVTHKGWRRVNISLDISGKVTWFLFDSQFVLNVVSWQ